MTNNDFRFHPITRVMFTLFFMSLTIIFSKVKLEPIFGTGSHFSLIVMFSPIIPKIVGTTYGSVAILGAKMIQFLVGISTPKSIISYLSYFPVLFGGIQFARVFKGDRKVIIFSLTAILLFLVHPIGRSVWYFSLFWLIPIIITLSKSYLDRVIKRFEILKIYIYALSATFVDHAFGSIIYLYFLEIPSIYWNMAIPFIPFERLIMALGITVFYIFISKGIELMERKTLAVLFISHREDLILTQKAQNMKES